MKLYISPEVLEWKTYAWGDTNEHIQMSKLAEKLKTAYEEYEGAELRIADKGLSVTTRNAMVNGKSVSGRIADAVNWGADVFVGLHSNARGPSSEGKPVKGAVLLHKVNDQESRDICLDVYAELAKIMPHDSPNGAVRSHPTFYEIVEPSQHGMKAVYIETEFHDQEDNARWIINNLDKIADAIAKGFAKAFGLVKQGTDSSGGGKAPTLKRYAFSIPYTAREKIQGYELADYKGAYKAIKDKGDPIRPIERADKGGNAYVLCELTGAWYAIKEDERWRVSDARPQTHTVKSGESYWSIAAKYLGNGMRYTEILDLNQVKDPSILLVGQVLQIPKK